MNTFRIVTTSLVGSCLSILVGCSQLQSTGDEGYTRPHIDRNGAFTQPGATLEECDEVKTLEECRKIYQELGNPEGTAIPPVKLQEGDILVKVTKEGDIVPVTRDGQPYKECSTDPKADNACRLFRPGITLTGLDEVSLIRLRYTGSGECEAVGHGSKHSTRGPYGGSMLIHYNPNDPDCREHHK